MVVVSWQNNIRQPNSQEKAAKKYCSGGQTIETKPLITSHYPNTSVAKRIQSKLAARKGGKKIKRTAKYQSPDKPGTEVSERVYTARTARPAEEKPDPERTESAGPPGPTRAHPEQETSENTRLRPSADGFLKSVKSHQVSSSLYTYLCHLVLSTHLFSTAT